MQGILIKKYGLSIEQHLFHYAYHCNGEDSVSVLSVTSKQHKRDYSLGCVGFEPTRFRLRGGGVNSLPHLLIMLSAPNGSAIVTSTDIWATLKQMVITVLRLVRSLIGRYNIRLRSCNHSRYNFHIDRRFARGTDTSAAIPSARALRTVSSSKRVVRTVHDAESESNYVQRDHGLVNPKICVEF